MTRPALIDVLPQWEPPENDPSASVDDWRRVWYGRVRIVRNRKRRRVLQRRGVIGWKLPGGRFAWFVEL